MEFNLLYVSFSSAEFERWGQGPVNVLLPITCYFSLSALVVNCIMVGLISLARSFNVIYCQMSCLPREHGHLCHQSVVAWLGTAPSLQTEPGTVARWSPPNSRTEHSQAELTCLYILCSLEKVPKCLWLSDFSSLMLWSEWSQKSHLAFFLWTACCAKLWFVPGLRFSGQINLGNASYLILLLQS